MAGRLYRVASSQRDGFNDAVAIGLRAKRRLEKAILEATLKALGFMLLLSAIAIFWLEIRRRLRS